MQLKIIFTLLLTALNVEYPFAQSSIDKVKSSSDVASKKISAKDNFTELIRHDIGDLNNDELIDSVAVNMDVLDETRPLKMEIFFAQPNGDYQLIISSTQIIEAMYPASRNGEFNGQQIPYFYIEDGSLDMVSDIKGGQASHKFKYNEGNFELIHFFKVVWDGKETTTETNYDLITGKFVQQSQLLGDDEYFNRIEKTIPTNKLPNIKDFIPFQKELY